MTGKLAVSKSGHDKNHIYAIVREDEAFVFLADGVIKTLENPKKKNRKHIQVIQNLPESVNEILNGVDGIRDLEIKRSIKLYVDNQEEKRCQKRT